MSILLIISAAFMALAVVLWGGRRSHGLSSRNSSDLDVHSVAGSYASQDDIIGQTISVRLFVIGFLARFGSVLILFITGAIEGGLSRDSTKYHYRGIEIAEQYLNGQADWGQWIDNGWYQLTGLVYSIFGPAMLWMQLLNVTLGATTGVLAYLIAKKIYRNEPVARFAGYLTCLFPSFIYYSSLPLKDTASLLALLLMVWGAVNLRDQFKARYFCYLVVALLIVLSLRDYLFFVCLGLLLASFGPVSSKKTVKYLALMSSAVLLFGCLAYSLGFGFFGLDFFETAKYFDLDYINKTRVSLNRGNTSLYDSTSQIRFGEGVLQDVLNLFTGLYYFFFSIDPSDVSRSRQLFAVPEMLILLLAVPALFRGVINTWRHKREIGLPVLVFGFGVMLVYTSATTNAGAMFRWRMQALPFFIMMVSYGVYLGRKGMLYRLMRRLYR